MEPMDYTMDDGRPSQQQNTPQRSCPSYLQPQHSPQVNTFSPQARDAHHYDPIHNTDVWYQTSNAQSRPNYVASQHPNMPSWSQVPHVPAQNWAGFGESYGGIRGPEEPGYRGPAGLPAAHWDGMANYEPFNFTYATYANASDEASTSAEASSGRISAPSSSVSIAAVQGSAFGQTSMRQTEITRRMTRSNSTSNHSSDPVPGSQQQSDAVMDSRAVRESYRNILEEQTTPQSHATRNGTRSQEPIRHRRHIYRRELDSEDDDDSLADDDEAYASRVIETESYGELAHRGGDLFLGPEMEEERALAFYRGATATGKKVASQSAISSLESVNPHDLLKADRTCIICYNEFGVQNPEGLIEAPLRLPRCKHVFGDHCIKKWFEDSDSCPYCRDRLPNEVQARSSAALESMRRHREALSARQQVIRAQHGLPLPPRYTSSDEFGNGTNSLSASNFLRRSEEEYRQLLGSRSIPPNPWLSSPNRPYPSDQPENRRRSRGRLGGNRALPTPARPNSIGSARFITPTTNHQTISQRAHIHSAASNANGTNHMPRRSITPGLPRQVGTGSSRLNIPQTPPRQRLSSGAASFSVEASPPVAVGSGVSIGEHLAAAREGLRSSDPRLSTASEASAVPQWSDSFGLFLNNEEENIFPQSRSSAIGRDNNILPPRIPPSSTRPIMASLTHQHPNSEAGNNVPQASMGDLDTIMAFHDIQEEGFRDIQSGQPQARWSR